MRSFEKHLEVGHEGLDFSAAGGGNLSTFTSN